MLIDFDHAVGQWRHLLRDWLSVIAEGPTDFLELPARGETCATPRCIAGGTGRQR